MQKTVKSFDNTKINYDISRSDGLFLVFIHGVGGDFTAWRKERAFLHRKGFSTIAIDLRGHGKSDRPALPIDYKLECFAKDIKAVLKKEKVSKFVLIGHCFGGLVTVMFHSLFPNSAKSYILIDTACKAPARLKKIFKNHPLFLYVVNHLLENNDLRNRHFKHVDFRKFVGTKDWDILRIYSDITHTSFKSWLFTYESLSDFDGTGIMKKIRKPTLIIEGDKDSIFSLPEAKKIHNLIKTSKLDIVPDANHILVINNSNTLEKEIYDFVK